MNAIGSRSALNALMISLCLLSSSFEPAAASRVSYRPVAYTLPTGAVVYRTKLEQTGATALGGPDGARRGARWINGSATFSLATEITRRSAGATTPEIRYIIEGAAQERPQTYSGPFSLGNRPDATYYVGYWSQDTAGHVETITQTEVFLDNTAPIISMSADLTDTTGSIFIPESLITIAGIDTGVGMKTVEWRIDTDEYQQYSSPVSVSRLTYGAHNIAYRASDLLGNTTESSFAFAISPALELSKERSFAPRTLVWWNYNTNGNEGNAGDGRSPVPSANRARVEAAVRAASIFSDTVSSGSAFVSGMRSGKYNVFVILGQKENLSQDNAAELAERVNAGAGLISSMTDNIPGPALANDNGSQARDNVLGIRVSGTYPNADPVIRISTGLLADTAYSMQAIGRVSRIRENLADTLGQYAGTRNPGEGDEHERVGRGSDRIDSALAATIRQYGAGKAAYLGFDIAAAATDTEGATVAGFIQRLLTIAKPETEPVVAGSMVAVEIRARSLVVPLALNISIDELLPSDVTLLSVSPPATLSGGAVVWTVLLDAGRETSVRYSASMPEQEGTISTDARISYLVRGAYRSVGPCGLSIAVQDARSNLEAASDLLRGLAAHISSSSPDRVHVDAASAILTEHLAHPPATAHDRSIAVKNLMKAISALTRIGSEADRPAAARTRAAIDAAILGYSAQGME